jgi:hypothetical protein
LNVAGHYPHESLLGHAQDRLLAFRRACNAVDNPAGRRPVRPGHPPLRR